MARDGKIYIAAYDSNYGDLAYTEVGFEDAQTAKLDWYPVDGLPSGEPMSKGRTPTAAATTILPMMSAALRRWR